MPIPDFFPHHPIKYYPGQPPKTQAASATQRNGWRASIRRETAVAYAVMHGLYAVFPEDINID